MTAFREQSIDSTAKEAIEKFQNVGNSSGGGGGSRVGIYSRVGVAGLG